MWVADPLSYDFSIHYTSPVLTGAQGEKDETKHREPRFCLPPVNGGST
jgi:hypothetical protein